MMRVDNKLMYLKALLIEEEMASSNINYETFQAAIDVRIEIAEDAIVIRGPSGEVAIAFSSQTPKPAWLARMVRKHLDDVVAAAGRLKKHSVGDAPQFGTVPRETRKDLDPHLPHASTPRQADDDNTKVAFSQFFDPCLVPVDRRIESCEDSLTEEETKFPNEETIHQKTTRTSRTVYRAPEID